MNRKKWIACALALLCALPGCSLALAEAEPIKIGVFEPLTGSQAEGGQMEYEGIQVAHSIRGEVLGRKIVLVTADNASDDAQAVEAARSLVQQHVSAVIGSWGSSLSIAGAPVFEAARIPAIGATCTNPHVTLGREYYSRVCFLDDFQGGILANYAKNTLGAKTAAILCDIKSTYAIGLRSYFVQAFGDENIVAEAYFDTGDHEFSSQLATVIEASPDIIFLPAGYLESAIIMQQARLLGYKETPFLGGDTWGGEALMQIGGKTVEGCFFTAAYDAAAGQSGAPKEFLDAYAALFDGEQPKGAAAALGYDAYMAAVTAIEQAGSTDGPAVQKALLGLTIDGATGTFSFDAIGDAVKDQGVIMTVKDGQFAYVETVKLD